MKSIFDDLRNHYNLKIEAPYKMNICNEIHSFQCLIWGYGAKKGMIVDKDYGKIQKVQKVLIEMGYGFSCFDIEKTSSIEGFQEVLNDWGKTVA